MTPPDRLFSRRDPHLVAAWIVLVIALLLVAHGQPQPVRASDDGWLLAAMRVNGQYDIVAMPAAGGDWRALTTTPGDERYPTLSPDGTQLLYAARRNRNWDLYLLDLATGREQRLTDDPHYDAFPAFSPDGRRIAFASMRTGDMDIWLLDLASGEQTNLTATSPAPELEPRWQDDGTLLFVSIRNDSQDLYRINIKGGQATALTETERVDERGAIRAGDDWLTVVRDDRRRYIAPLGGGAPLSWGEGVYSAAVAPDGTRIAWLERRLAGDTLFMGTPDGAMMDAVRGPQRWLDDLTWGSAGSDMLARRLAAPRSEPRAAPYVAKPSSLARIEGLDTVSPYLSERVAPSYERLRARVNEELGWDFLGTVSETIRAVDYVSDDSDPLSWHKAGRAVDTLFSLGWRRNVEQMEIIRDDWHGDVYWSMWLRCPAQDGSCGEPIIEAPWDFFYEARWDYAPGEGGLRSTPPAGYYVNFTRLAADEGWERISAHEDPAFDWRNTTTAMEYWHFQETSGLRWYQAMEELHDAATMESLFSPGALVADGIPRWLMRAKGIPLPPELRHAPATIVAP